MPQFRKFRAPRMVRRPLKYAGAIPTPPSPSLSDVMNALSQIQQNQTQIMNTITAIAVNQAATFLCEATWDVALAPNRDVANAINDDFQSTWAQWVSF